jgi:hypothetical protein
MPNALRKSRARKGKTVTEENPIENDVANTDENTYSEDNADATPAPTNDTEETTVSTDYAWDTDQEQHQETDGPALPDFASLIEDAPEDYKPERASAGRKREPSPFDNVLPGLKDKGYKRVPIVVPDGGNADEVVKEIKRQLQKAQHYHGLGMDLNVTTEYVEFQIRDLQKREKKTAGSGSNGQTALDENASADGVEQDADDRDE